VLFTEDVEQEKLQRTPEEQVKPVFYGVVQGIIGSSLAEIEGMDMLAIEAKPIVVDLE
jgi:hypothetical protein